MLCLIPTTKNQKSSQVAITEASLQGSVPTAGRKNRSAISASGRWVMAKSGTSHGAKSAVQIPKRIHRISVIHERACLITCLFFI